MFVRRLLQRQSLYKIVTCCIMLNYAWGIINPINVHIVYVDLVSRGMASLWFALLVKKLIHYPIFLKYSQIILTVTCSIIVSIYPINMYLFDRFVVKTTNEDDRQMQLQIQTTSSSSSSSQYYYYHDGFVIGIGYIGCCIVASSTIGCLLCKYQVLYCTVTMIVTYTLLLREEETIAAAIDETTIERVTYNHHHDDGYYKNNNTDNNNYYSDEDSSLFLLEYLTFVLKCCKVELILVCIVSSICSYVIELQLRQRFILHKPTKKKTTTTTTTTTKTTTYAMQN